MSFQTREAVITELRAMLPPGTSVRATAHNPRRSESGVMRTSIRVFSAQGDNISDAAAIATNNRHSAADDAMHGYFGGLGPAQQAVGELSLALHGSSTALRLAPSLTPAPRSSSAARISGRAR